MFLRIIIVGNLGRDPELRYTQTGQPVTTLSVAANRQWTDKNTNELKKETTWFRVTVWGNQAEHCNEYLRKGSPVLIEADRIQASPYLTKEGQPAASLEVTAQTIRFLGGRGGQMEEGGMQDSPDDLDAIPF